MERIKKAVIVISALVLALSFATCGENQKISKAVGNYVMDARHYGKKFSNNRTLTISHLRGNRYSYKYYDGDKLKYDDINIIKGTHTYDLKEKQSLGSFTDDFSSVKARNKTYNRKN